MCRVNWLVAFLFLTSHLHAQTRVTLYEGARLITGDGSAIENSAFLVEDTQFTQVGRRGQVRAPAGAARARRCARRACGRNNSTNAPSAPAS